MLDNLPLPRDRLQCLCHVFADLVQVRAAAARAGRRRRLHNPFPQQMLRQRTPRGLFSLECAHDNRLLPSRRKFGGRLAFGRSFLGFGKLQLELLDTARDVPRLAVLFVAQLAIWNSSFSIRARVSLARQRVGGGGTGLMQLGLGAIRSSRAAISSAFSVSTSSGRESIRLPCKNGITKMDLVIHHHCVRVTMPQRPSSKML